MHIKKGDNVIVISGADKGKTGKVIKSFPDRSVVVVEGVNMRKKHEHARRTDQKGQVIQKPNPIHVSSIAIADPANGKPTRVSIKMVGGKRVRVTKKSGSSLS